MRMRQVNLMYQTERVVTSVQYVLKYNRESNEK